MTNEERINGLRAWGYTEREAAFLALAALASGYFVRRQFCQFTGTEYGYADAQLVRKLESFGHCTVIQLLCRTCVYHLSYAPLYEHLGERENRNRRSHFAGTMKARVMSLDYIIQNQKKISLLTEREKVPFFREELHLAESVLPSKVYVANERTATTTRFFVEKFPILIDPITRAPYFAYIDEGVKSVDGYRTFLERYSGLFDRLESFHVVYVAAVPYLVPTFRNWPLVPAPGARTYPPLGQALCSGSFVHSMWHTFPTSFRRRLDQSLVHLNLV